MSELGTRRAWCSNCEGEVEFVAPVSLNAARGRAFFDLVLAGGDPSSGICPRCAALVVSLEPWFCCDFGHEIFLACVPQIFADPSLAADPATTALLAPMVQQLRVASTTAALTLTADTAATREKLLAAQHGIDWVQLERAKLAPELRRRLRTRRAARLVAADADTCWFELYDEGGRHHGLLGQFGLSREVIATTTSDAQVVHELGDHLRIVDATFHDPARND